MPKAATLPSVKTMPDLFLYLDAKTRVQSKDEWNPCRQSKILKFLEKYQYGYYPDHTSDSSCDKERQRVDSYYSCRREDSQHSSVTESTE
jgi:hypothetical protein